jgi:hypothetical protein
MQTAAIILALAALGGLVMVIIRLRGAPQPPMWLAVGHGVIAATGLGYLVYTVATITVPQLAQIATGVFVLAALGGSVLFFGFHLARKALPVPLVIGHGAIAVVAYVMLLIALTQ